MKPGLSQHEHRRETVLGTLLKTSARIWVPDMSHLIKLLCHKKKKFVGKTGCIEISSWTRPWDYFCCQTVLLGGKWQPTPTLMAAGFSLPFSTLPPLSDPGWPLHGGPQFIRYFPVLISFILKLWLQNLIGPLAIPNIWEHLEQKRVIDLTLVWIRTSWGVFSPKLSGYFCHHWKPWEIWHGWRVGVADKRRQRRAGVRWNWSSESGLGLCLVGHHQRSTLPLPSGGSRWTGNGH